MYRVGIAEGMVVYLSDYEHEKYKHRLGMWWHVYSNAERGKFDRDEVVLYKHLMKMSEIDQLYDEVQCLK